MATDNALGEFLRARREAMPPPDSGWSGPGDRRVTGLRREEVAFAAGISADYYVRLEQGRYRHPSDGVLAALGQALALDDSELSYLRRLANPPPSTVRTRTRRRRPVPENLRLLLDTIGVPAFVEDAQFDVLAANGLATALSPSFAAGRNRLLSMFLDPGDELLFTTWRSACSEIVAAFRASAGGDHENPRVVEIVGELSTKSAEFRRLWARHDVAPRVGAPPLILAHPRVGELTLMREKLPLPGTSGQMLVLWHAAPGSASHDALALLAPIAAETTART